MKTKFHFALRASHFALAVAFLSTLNSQLSTLHAQGTAFTYQGRLNDGPAPSNGTYALKFSVFGASSGGNAIAAVLFALPGRSWQRRAEDGTGNQ